MKGLWLSFEQFDVDGSGDLTADEVVAILTRQSGGHPMTLEDAEEFVAQFDANHDGKLSYAEFCTAMGQPSPPEGSIAHKIERVRLALGLEAGPLPQVADAAMEALGVTDGDRPMSLMEKVMHCHDTLFAAAQPATAVVVPGELVPTAELIGHGQREFGQRSEVVTTMQEQTVLMTTQQQQVVSNGSQMVVNTMTTTSTYVIGVPVSTIMQAPVESLDFKLYGRHRFGGSWGFTELQGQLHVLTTNYRDHSHVDVYDLELTKLHSYTLPPARTNSITATSSEVFIAFLSTSSEPATVRVYRPDGTFVREWSSGLTHPQCIEACDDEIFVGDAGPHTIKVFDVDGHPLRQWPSPIEPKDMTVDGCELYLTHWNECCVSVHDTQTGEEKRRWGARSPWALFNNRGGRGGEATPPGGTFWEPCGIAAACGFVFTIEYGGQRVQAFTSDGRFLRTIHPELGDLTGVFVDSRLRVFVNNRGTTLDYGWQTAPDLPVETAPAEPAGGEEAAPDGTGVPVVAFHPHHQKHGYGGDFFGVTLADAAQFSGGTSFVVVGKDGKEHGPFVVKHVTGEMRHEGLKTGIKYVYTPWNDHPDPKPGFHSLMGRDLLVGDILRIG